MIYFHPLITYELIFRMQASFFRFHRYQLVFSLLSNLGILLLFQVIAFQEIISALRLVVSKGVRPPWSKLLNITVGIRHNTLDYSDKFQWDVLSESGGLISSLHFRPDIKTTVPLCADLLFYLFVHSFLYLLILFLLDLLFERNKS